MDLSLVLVFCAATLSLVHTNHVLDSVQRNTLHADSIIQTSFGFRDEHGEQTKRSETSSIVSSPQKKRRSVSSDPSNLKLAAFNVRTFGTKKMATPGVPDILVKIILRYDVILIQEIRDASGKAIQQLLSLVNKYSTKGLYKITISPRLGRTSSKEQYAFLYRKDVLSVKHTYVYDDGKEELKTDTFEREPYIVHFTSTRTNLTDFVLVAIHTSPSKANQEIHELAAVYDDVTKKLAITNVIILGDLNAACSYMSDSDWKTNRLANDNRFHWLISDCVDTTVTGGHCAYDRFVVAGDAILDAVSESSPGSYKYDEDLNINKTMALLVSDHYPVEMQLYSKELAKAMAQISKAVEYTYKMKQHPSLRRSTVYGMRKKKAIKDAGFKVETTYSVTFSKDFKSLKEAMNAIRVIKDNMIKVNMISFDQTQNAEFHLNEVWVKEKQTGTVKIVCKTSPQTTCWIALLQD
ncbi:deoxyribonuclease-1-like [Oculina patagonica]